jgi:hypothetical protein
MNVDVVGRKNIGQRALGKFVIFTAGLRILDTGYWILDTGCWIPDTRIEDSVTRNNDT